MKKYTQEGDLIVNYVQEVQVGEYFEVGIGESTNDEDGYSYYFQMDLEGYNIDEIISVFEKYGNVLYAIPNNDESTIHFANGAKFSDHL